MTASTSIHDYDPSCDCSHCEAQAMQCGRQMKSLQREPRHGRIPRGPLSVTQYMQPQRFAYRLAAGLARLRDGEK